MVGCPLGVPISYYRVFELLEMDVYKKIDTNAQSILTTLYEPEIFLLRLCRNFASVKEGFIECLFYALVKKR